MPDEPRFTRSAETSVVEMAPGIVRRTLGWGDRMLVAEVSLAKGSIVQPHAHPHEQVGYVAQGRLQFTIGEATAVLERGDGYAIPGGVSHSVVALADSIAVDVFSPVRQEYK